ncbi:MAG TPA: hypothetical protein PKD85_14180, partial [Saprospiraceae bacterium]|nr:hypothetical protein [Saprospiraceae bacterium]
MKNILKIGIRLSIFLIALIFINDINATHIVGGDMTYKYLGKDTFEITLTMRRDCQLGSPEAQFDSPALVSIYDGQSGRVRIDLGYFGALMMPFSQDDTLNTFVRSDCGFEGTQVCVHETKYVKKVHLPFSPTGYFLVYQRCCRNSSLNNIIDPLDAGSTYFVKINGPTMDMRNNSPVFKAWPDVYICADTDLVFDHSAVDADGDSLVYKLWNPIYGLTMRSPR